LDLETEGRRTSHMMDSMEFDNRIKKRHYDLLLSIDRFHDGFRQCFLNDSLIYDMHQLEKYFFMSEEYGLPFQQWDVSTNIS
jgi:hypothetical protein